MVSGTMCIMGTLKEYQCNGCGYTITGTRKGRTLEQMMELFDASQQDISYHINQIYDDGEQDPNRTHKKFLLVRQEGTRSL